MIDFCLGSTSSTSSNCFALQLYTRSCEVHPFGIGDIGGFTTYLDLPGVITTLPKTVKNAWEWETVRNLPLGWFWPFSGELLVSRRVHVFLYVFNDGYAVVQVFRPDTLKDTYAMATLVTTLFFDGTKRYSWNGTILYSNTWHWLRSCRRRMGNQPRFDIEQAWSEAVPVWHRGWTPEITRTDRWVTFRIVLSWQWCQDIILLSLCSFSYFGASGCTIIV